MIQSLARVIVAIAAVGGGSVDPLILHPGPWCSDRMILHVRSETGERPGATGMAVVPLNPLAARALSNMPGVRHVEASVQLIPLLDVATSDSALMTIDTVYSYLGVAADGAQSAGHGGAGCLVAVVDNGFDIAHPDFVDSSGASRVLYLWDQTAAGGSPPPGFDYGTLWTGLQIDQGLCTQTSGAHGTRVLGIAAGNGRGWPDHRYRGVAPLASLLLVKTAGATADLVDALVWMAETARGYGLPVSINVSLGSHYGAHDGTRADELAIHAVTGPGTVVSCAAGNSDGVPIHARGQVPGQGAASSVVLSMNDYAQTPATEGFGVDLWYPAGCSLWIGLRDPLGAFHGGVPMGDTLSVDGSCGWVWIANDVDLPLNGDHHALLMVTDDGAADSVCAGEWEVAVEGTGRGVWDAWLFLRSHGAASFLAPDSSCSLVMPATAESCITVGGYLRDGGDAYPFSSRGPTRDGRSLPDLCAPTYVTTSNPGGGYALFGGTSASAPFVAGAAALALGRTPVMSASAVREQLRASARSDACVASSGALPGDKWGFGKLYVEPLVRFFSLTQIVSVADTTVTLTWELAAGARTYEVYRDSTAFFHPDSTAFSNRVASLSSADDGDSAPDFQWTDPCAVLQVSQAAVYVVRALKDTECWWSTHRIGAFTRAGVGERRDP